MIGLDTNILLRAVLDDDPVQSPAAQRLLRGLSPDQPGLINLLVLLEFFWVLRSSYKLPQVKLAGIMHDLLESQHLNVEAFETVAQGLAAYENQAADFADAVIALRNRDLGAERTFTFDEGAAASIPSMELLA